MKKNDERDPGNNRAVKKIVNFHRILAPLNSRSLIFGWNISSQGTHKYEDHDDRL